VTERLLGQVSCVRIVTMDDPDAAARFGPLLRMD
jgi:hypothetical protein